MVSSALTTAQAQINLLFEQIHDLVDERNRTIKIDLLPLESDDRELERIFQTLSSSIQSFQANKSLLSDNKKRYSDMV